MDIPKLSMAMSNMNTSQQVSIAMMKKTMDSAKQQSNDLMKMMETTTVDPNSSGKLNLSV